jgi:hypothetical protein
MCEPGRCKSTAIRCYRQTVWSPGPLQKQQRNQCAADLTGYGDVATHSLLYLLARRPPPERVSVYSVNLAAPSVAALETSRTPPLSFGASMNRNCAKSWKRLMQPSFLLPLSSPFFSVCRGHVPQRSWRGAPLSGPLFKIVYGVHVPPSFCAMTQHIEFLACCRPYISRISRRRRPAAVA